jgi:hypothetical protein
MSLRFILSSEEFTGHDIWSFYPISDTQTLEVGRYDESCEKSSIDIEHSSYKVNSFGFGFMLVDYKLPRVNKIIDSIFLALLTLRIASILFAPPHSLLDVTARLEDSSVRTAVGTNCREGSGPDLHLRCN